MTNPFIYLNWADPAILTFLGLFFLFIVVRAVLPPH